MRLRKNQQTNVEGRVVALLQQRYGEQISYADIAQAAGVQRRSAINLVQRLEDNGVIKRVKNASSEANSYDLV